MPQHIEVIKRKFVDNVIASLPWHDYTDELQAIVDQHAIKYMPEDILSIYTNDARRHWLHYQIYYVYYQSPQLTVKVYIYHGCELDAIFAPIADKIQGIVAKHKLQCDENMILRTKIREELKTKRSIDQIAKAFPDYVQCIPDYEERMGDLRSANLLIKDISQKRGQK